MNLHGKKLSSFAEANEQQQVLAAWRAKAEVRSAKVNSFAKKVVAHKEAAKQTSKRARWLADRDTLNEEQDACEEQLLVALHALLPTLQEELMESAATTQAMRDRIQEGFVRVKGCLHALSQPHDDHDERAHLTLDMRQRLESLRAFVALSHEELRRCESEEAGLFQPSESVGSQTLDSTLATSAVDFPALFEMTKLRCVKLRSAYPDQEYLAVHDAFQQALLFEEERCEARAEEQQTPPLPSLTDSFPGLSARVLGSVSLILKMAENARRVSVNAAASCEVVDRVMQTFPKLSRREIDAAIEECQRRRRSQRMQRLMALDYKRATASLLSTYAAALRAQQMSLAMEREMAEERAARDAKQANMHERLAEQRVAYEELQRMRKESEDRAAAVAQKRAEASQAAQARDLQIRLQRLSEYMKAREEAQQREAELAALRASEEKVEKEAQMEANMRRVAFRQQEYQERQAQRAAKEVDLQLAQEAKEAALARFFLSVEKQLDVQPSRERLLQATEASKQTSEYVPLAQATSTTGATMGGYSDEQIMRDPRVRLYRALLEAGLHNTPYGREVAARGFRVAPAQRTSKDNPLF